MFSLTLENELEINEALRKHDFNFNDYYKHIYQITQKIEYLHFEINKLSKLCLSNINWNTLPDILKNTHNNYQDLESIIKLWFTDLLSLNWLKKVKLYNQTYFKYYDNDSHPIYIILDWVLSHTTLNSDYKSLLKNIIHTKVF